LEDNIRIELRRKKKMGKCELDTSGSQVPLVGSWETSNEPCGHKETLEIS
jgi:hypothetical protein